MKKFLVSLALIASVLTIVPMHQAHASSGKATPNGGGIYPPSPLVVYQGTQPTTDGDARPTLTLTHQAVGPNDVSWSCSIFVNAGKAGTLPVVYMQGYQSCNLPMNAMYLTFYYRTCAFNWFGGCVLPGPSQYTGFPSCYASWGNTSQWCPANGTYNKAFNSGQIIQIIMQATDTGWDGQVAAGSVESGGIQL